MSINRYKQTFLLYFRNPSFALLAGIFLLSAIISKTLYMVNQSFFAEEISIVLFVVTFWLTFHFGILIKKQFANHRALLVPKYRSPHLNCVFILYILFIIIGCLWEYGLKPRIEIGPEGLYGGYISCLLIALCVTYLGYLSIGKILIYAYGILLMASYQALNLIALFETQPLLKYAIAIVCILFVMIFRKRLLNLKEDHFEYGYLFSWPPKHYISSQLRANQYIDNFFSPIKRLFRIKDKILSIPKYPRQKNILERAYHWDYIEHKDIKVIWLIFLLITPIYLLFSKNHPAVEGFFKNVYSNFFLLSVTPVLVTIGEHYKKMAYWGYDLLKPISKVQYIKERGVLLFISLFLYWSLFSICFAFLPSIIYKPDVFVLKKFWGFMLLTWSFSFMLLSWIIWLSSKSNTRVFILNGIILGSITLFQFYLAPKSTIGMIVIANTIYLLMGATLLKFGFQAWSKKEFI